MSKDHTSGLVAGVRGLWARVDAKTDALFRKQEFTTEWRTLKYDGTKALIRATIRFDDSCNNGHNSFGITGEIVKSDADGLPRLRECDWLAGGCCHEDIAVKFPELAPLIKWHLTSSDGPMHYIANTTYHASNRDHYGLLKGEKQQIINGKTKQPSWKLSAVNEAGEEINLNDFDKYFDGETPPETTVTLKYVPWCRVGDGKERNLDAARSCAIWPEATDEELCAPRDVLEATLKARHPALMASFKADIIAAGILWEPARVEA